ncbi:HlyD family type I secretion periplasmic adaptor subunit [Methylogaea oryzae]|uniref:Membrane fusion protein (MFP) family protein n=2 Tax=Methylogaea oryzae TaxID=1295382 RepID=A0A8D4VQ14_9GAMM|nr:HlyD family type I secretion periplasmic adaptor subunit [Methylogaea oryzae]BBL71945.1 HlyD family type I secretion periplasmic adaptor subunit [Methylogaea oryzae]
MRKQPPPLDTPDAAENSPIRLGSRQRHLLADSVHIEEEFIPDFIRPMLGLGAVIVVLFFLWASLTHVTEVARAPGEVIPIGKSKTVQHLDGGVVQEILAEERMLVQEGQVLLRLDGSQAQAELRQTAARLVALKLRAERLSAFADGREPDFRSLAGPYADLLADQVTIYRNQIATRDSTLSILDRQIEQRKQRIAQSQTALAAAKQHQALTGEMVRMREDLAARQLVKRTVLLETLRAKVTADSEVTRIREDIGVSQQELAETLNRREDTINQLRHDALNEMGSVRAQIAEVEESIQHLKAKVHRLVITAPHRGYVQDLKVLTLGQVIQPGAVLMQIVPDDMPLEAEIHIQPKDIGYVRADQRVNLKVLSFDYSRYGFATGVLKRVAASSTTDDSNQTFYRGWVTLDHPYVGKTPGRNLLQPGMGVEAEILTGEKTVLAYLSKPVIDVVTRSFHER